MAFVLQRGAARSWARAALLTAALVCATASLCVTAAERYPNRPVRIIVPLAAGGGMDSVTRGLAQKLSEIWGETVVVDNRPGAGSQLGLEVLSSASPDGHTL